MKKSILAIVCIALLSLCFTSNASAQIVSLVTSISGPNLMTSAPTYNNGRIEFTIANDADRYGRVDFSGSHTSSTAFTADYYGFVSFQPNTNEFTITLTRSSGTTEYMTARYKIQ